MGLYVYKCVYDWMGLRMFLGTTLLTREMVIKYRIMKKKKNMHIIHLFQSVTSHYYVLSALKCLKSKMS